MLLHGASVRTRAVCSFRSILYGRSFGLNKCLGLMLSPWVWSSGSHRQQSEQSTNFVFLSTNDVRCISPSKHTISVLKTTKFTHA